MMLEDREIELIKKILKKALPKDNQNYTDEHWEISGLLDGIEIG